MEGGIIPISEETARPEYYMRGLEALFNINTEILKDIRDTLQQGSTNMNLNAGVED